MSASFLSEANKLKNIQLFLEKNNFPLEHISKYAHESNLFDYIVDTELKRKNEIDQTHQELRIIWRLLKSKNKQVLLEENLNNLDLSSFKQEMIELQNKIDSLQVKLSSTSRALRDEEKILWDVNQLFNQKLEEWEKPLRIQSSHNYRASRTACARTSDHKEISAFMDFVNKSNGHENGWASEDHQLFLKLRHKHKNVHDLAVNLNKLLPDISIDDVKHHEGWFKRYIFLKNQKDEALERWRKQRKELSALNTENDSQNTQTVNRKIYKHKPKDENTQEQIAQWKAEKEAKRQQEVAYAQQKREKLKRHEEEKKILHSQVKQIVTKWKEARIVKEENEKLQNEMQEYYQKRIRAATANKLIKQFQSHDDCFIAKMRANKLKENNRSKVRSKSSYQVDRNPGRILQPTKQWLQRTTKDESEVQVLPYVPNIRAIPKLKVPEWRKKNQV